MFSHFFCWAQSKFTGLPASSLCPAHFCWHRDFIRGSMQWKNTPVPERNVASFLSTISGLRHSKSKTMKDKAVSFSLVPRLCLSFSRQTLLSCSGVWVRHKIFLTALELQFRAISVTGQIVDYKMAANWSYECTVNLRPIISFELHPKLFHIRYLHWVLVELRLFSS